MKDVRNIDGKIVGHITDRILRKKVKASKHLMKVLNGYGWDTRILEEDFDEVQILDTENEIMYVSRKEDWLTHGIRKNFNHGDQIILPLRHHEARHKNQQQLI
jgi:hypothetical protein